MTGSGIKPDGDSTLRRLQQAEMHILLEFRRICEAHGLRYWLAFGTMLGAVRHQGFIPWDDDIDVGMPADDYDRFLKIAPQELGEDFYLDTPETDPFYGLFFAKIRLKGTRFVGAKENRATEHGEVFMDIFPFIYRADDPKVRERESREMIFWGQLLLMKAHYTVWAGDPFTKYLKFLPVRAAAAVLSRKQILDKVHALYGRNPSRTGFVSPFMGTRLGAERSVLATDILESFTEASFEGETFTIPAQYDRYLTTVYGADYMTPPPPEKRVTHLPVEMDLGRF